MYKKYVKRILDFLIAIVAMPFVLIIILMKDILAINEVDKWRK